MKANHFGADLAASYQGFLSGLTACYLAAQAGGISLHDFRARAATSVQDFIQRAGTAAAGYVEELALDGYSEPLGAFVDQLRRIVSKNAADLTQKLSGGVRLADMLTRPAGAVGTLLRMRVSAPRFTASDSAGRAWPAEKLVPLIARQFAYNALIDAQAAGIEGDLAEVFYADQTHMHFGSILSISGASSKYPSLESLRQAIFHPNASAELRTHVQT